jgi:hypothetical protein
MGDAMMVAGSVGCALEDGLGKLTYLPWKFTYLTKHLWGYTLRKGVN